MGISRSSETDGWIGGASVYSGRRDPTWRVAAELSHVLEATWTRLPPWSGPRPQAPALGYRGCWLKAPDGRTWTAYRELVTLASDDRRDVEREFERSLLASAPAGLLPPTLL
jgi:hypothetical protein